MKDLISRTREGIENTRSVRISFFSIRRVPTETVRNSSAMKRRQRGKLGEIDREVSPFNEVNALSRSVFLAAMRKKHRFFQPSDTDLTHIFN